MLPPLLDKVPEGTAGVLHKAKVHHICVMRQRSQPITLRTTHHVVVNGNNIRDVDVFDAPVPITAESLKMDPFFVAGDNLTSAT